jgi:hypothetical protein
VDKAKRDIDNFYEEYNVKKEKTHALNRFVSNRLVEHQDLKTLLEMQIMRSRILMLIKCTKIYGKGHVPEWIRQERRRTSKILQE